MHRHLFDSNTFDPKAQRKRIIITVAKSVSSAKSPEKSSKLFVGYRTWEHHQKARLQRHLPAGLT